MHQYLYLLDKPAGITSHDVVDRVRRIFHTRRVGHAGTLDPFATGLLIVGVGTATKELATYVGLEKTYIATARLGATSTTDDPEGIIVPFPDLPAGKHDTGEWAEGKVITKVLQSFLGTYDQIVPIYSAKKVGGKKLYELARKGLGDTVERPRQRVTIYEIKLLEYAWPEVTFQVTCSSGTYIRALARDLGEKLGTGAYLIALRRTRIGTYKIEDAQTLEELQHSSKINEG